MPKPTDLICLQCHKPLEGRRKKFCSDQHKKDYWNQHFNAGKSLEYVDPKLEALWMDFVRMMKKHGFIGETQ